MEKIFNIFPICDDRIISHIGFCIHEFVGEDEEKIQYLLSKVEEDSKKYSITEVPSEFKVKLPNGKEINGLTHERYNSLLHNGTDGVLYEEIFQLFGAPQFPLSVSTMIVNGEIKVTEQKRFETVPKTEFTTQLVEQVPEYYLKAYMSEKGFALSELINADFFDAIRILYNNQKFVSSLKLLMSAIDTFSFLEYGDRPNNFKDWLDKYCDLSVLKLTNSELWEYRNSILHMTNSYSRKVINKKINQLSFYVGENDLPYMISNGEAKYFNLFSLINCIAEGIDNWGESFNSERSKFEIFCDRYDLIMSDQRYSKLNPE